MVFNNYILSVSIDQPVTLYTIVFVLMYVTIIHVHICTWLVCDLNQSACNADRDEDVFNNDCMHKNYNTV